jgi:hypothetical protein
MREVEFKVSMKLTDKQFDMITLCHTLVLGVCGSYYLVVRCVRGLFKGLSRFVVGGIVGAGRAFLEELERASTDFDALLLKLEAAEAEGRVYPVRPLSFFLFGISFCDAAPFLFFSRFPFRVAFSFRFPFFCVPVPI